MDATECAFQLQPAIKSCSNIEEAKLTETETPEQVLAQKRFASCVLVTYLKARNIDREYYESCLHESINK